MKYYAKIGNSNTLYDVYPSIKVVDKLSEELDMVEFTLKPIDYELDLDFKKYNGLVMVTLFVDDVVYKYLYLSYYKCVNVAYSPNKMYKYVLQCVSPTIALQRITLPNKLITQPISSSKRTIYEEVVKIRDVYCNWLEFADELQELLNVPCPQMQFTKSTLHEILISLFAVVNLVPKMLDYDMLGYLSLEGISSEHPIDDIIRIEKQNSIDNYCDALDYDIENAISDDNDITTTWITPTTDEAMLTTENFLWELPSEIYEIKKVEVMANIKVEDKITEENIYLNKVDITDNVVHKLVWDTFRTSSKADPKDTNEIRYKRNNLYYEGKKIYGNFTEKNYLNIELPLSIIKVIINAVSKQYDTSKYNISLTVDNRDIALKVTYQSELDNARINIIKQGVEFPQNFMISNQDDAYIDAINFGKQKQEFINRLGNEVATGQCNFKINNINTLFAIPDLGEWVEDYIITQREMMLKENNILINYQLTKDYVLKTGYSGLKQMKRFTSIDTENTMIRNDLLMFNFKFSFNSENNDNSFENTTSIAEMIINNYGNESDNGKTLHLVNTIDKQGRYLGFGDERYSNNNEYFLVNAQNKFIANFVTSQFTFETNAKVGDYTLIEDDTKAYSKVPVRYVDNNGEFKYIAIKFGQGEPARDIQEVDVIRKYPLIRSVGYNKGYIRKLINKDNREITAISMQFRVVNNKDEGIFVYDNFLKHCDLYPHSATTLFLYTQYYKDLEDFEKNKYNMNTKNVIGQASNSIVTFNGNERSITFNNVLSETGFFTIGLVDRDNNLLLGINYENINTIFSSLKIYLNN